MDIDVLVIPELPSLITQWVATLILFLIVRKFVYNPMKEFLNKRQEVITQQIADAEDSRKKAMELKTSYEENLKNAREEGNRIVEESRNRGKDLEKQLKEEGRVEANKILEKARLQIAKEKEMAFLEIKDSTSDMAIAIAEKLIQENLDKENQQGLIDQFIKELEVTNV